MITFNKNNIHTKLSKICSVSFLSLMIAACTQTNPAQVEDISNSPNAAPIRVVTDTSSSGSYSPPPSNIGAKREVVSTQPADSNSSSYSSSTTKDNGNVVTTTQEKIVYNRNYDEIPKSGYKGDTYTVKRGDTLFYIAWITGNDFRALAAKNEIKAPYELNVGQVLDVSGGATVVVTQKTTTNSAGAVKPTTTTTTTTSTSTTSKTQPPTTKTTTTTSTNPIVTAPTASNSAKVANITWIWPAQGKVIERFSNATKGIDISGTLGEKIVSAADGRVVYAGNALPGYGNLIIVKHNDDYLTAYAHNQNILVKEQQDVKAGQQIATMGSTGTSSVRLHFEIRYKAQSVDPLKYLPKK